MHACINIHPHNAAATQGRWLLTTALTHAPPADHPDMLMVMWLALHHPLPSRAVVSLLTPLLRTHTLESTFSLTPLLAGKRQTFRLHTNDHHTMVHRFTWTACPSCSPLQLTPIETSPSGTTGQIPHHPFFPPLSPPHTCCASLDSRWRGLQPKASCDNGELLLGVHRPRHNVTPAQNSPSFTTTPQDQPITPSSR